jgi:hypothetical protein
MNAVRYLQIAGALTVATLTLYATKASAVACPQNGPVNTWDTVVCCQTSDGIDGCGDGDFFGPGDKYIKAYQDSSPMHQTTGVGMLNDLTVLCSHPTTGTTGSSPCSSSAVRVGVRIQHL